MQKFAGRIYDWNVGKSSRMYVFGTMKYGQLRNAVQADVYCSNKNEGEQRDLVKSHVNYLKEKMIVGNFSPCPITLGTKSVHRNKMGVKGNELCLEIDNDRLPILDGNHRLAALELIRSSGDIQQKITDAIYVPYVLYLDGMSRVDFVNLQYGRPVSKDHLLSIRISDNLIDKKTAPYFSIAKETAKILNDDPECCFYNLIQFDSRSGKLPLSLNSLCRKGASELAFSLYGGAKIASLHGKDAKWLANCIKIAYQAVKGNNQILPEHILCPKPDGTKAGTAFIIALGNMLAGRLMLKEIDEVSNSDINVLVESVRERLTVPIKGNTSSDRKRVLFGEFASLFFSDLESECDPDEEEPELDCSIVFHQGIPVPLIKVLSASTFNVRKLSVEIKTKVKEELVSVGNSYAPWDDDDDDVLDIF